MHDGTGQPRFGAAKAAGVALRIDARALLGSSAARRQRAGELCAVASWPASIAIAGLGDDARRAKLRLAAILEFVAAVRAALAADVPPPEIVVDCGVLAADDIAAARSNVPFGTATWLVVPARYLRTSRRDGEAARYWQSLYELRAGGVAALLPHELHSACPLLPGEPADAALPGGLQAPAGSAWISFRLSLADFVSGGALDLERIDARLQSCVTEGDRLHDRVYWPTPSMRHDAWLNRRLAIVIGGIGDAAARMQMDPASLSSLHAFEAIVQRARRKLEMRSRELAETTQPLPALAASDPSRRLPAGASRSNWQRRWRKAAASVAVRHRNLLIVEPWGLVPATGEATYRYADLLPLMRHADGCAMQRRTLLASWNVDEFRRFHERLHAVLARREEPRLIAEQS